jgi:hypothetical protein
MQASTHNTTASRSEQIADLTGPPAGNLVAIWTRGRRRITPWAYPRLRALAAVRFVVGIFLTGLGALMLSHGHDGWAPIPLAGAVLVFSIACLDMAAARSAAPRP